jgi:hypothetical protein
METGKGFGAGTVKAGKKGVKGVLRERARSGTGPGLVKNSGGDSLRVDPQPEQHHPQCRHASPERGPVPADRRGWHRAGCEDFTPPFGGRAPQSEFAETVDEFGVIPGWLV